MAGTLGVFTGSNTNGYTYANWLGRSPDFITAFTSDANWKAYVDGIGYAARSFQSTGAQLNWTIPIFTKGSTLEQAAAGAYNAHYVQAAKALLAADPHGSIYIRTAQEFNGNWMAWSAVGRETTFIQAYRNFVDAFRSVSDKFKFEWNVNIGQEYHMNPEKAYPGDKYVDIVGMDFYYHTTWDKPNAQDAWDYNVTRPYGLQWLEDFAKAHGKPTAYSEWGVNSPDAAVYMKNAADWFSTHNIVYQNYWDSDANFYGKVSDGGLGATSQGYRDAFAHLPSGNQGVKGNNSYVVASASTVVNETVGAGTDKVYASVDFSLSDTTHARGSIENLTLFGRALVGTGNGLANTITGNLMNNTLSGLAGNDILLGNDGNDVLKGGAGADTLTGGNGSDRFVFDTALGASTNTDRITDFTVAQKDKIVLDTSIFTKLAAGALAADSFVIGARAADASDRVIYNKDTGALSYDADGNGSGAAVQFATLSKGLALSAASFDVVAGVKPAATAATDVVKAPPSPAAPSAPPSAPPAPASPTGTPSSGVTGGTAGNDYFDMTKGVHSIDGGAGSDAASFHATGAIGLNLQTGQGTSGATLGYKFMSIEKIIGSSFADSVVGSDGNNVIDGRGGDDRLDGGAGNDTIMGGAGNDVLTGGKGHDTFFFNSGPNSKTNVDKITDFSVANDTISLSRGTFTSLKTAGELSADAFYAGTAAHDGNDRILYDAKTGSIFYDLDGNGAAKAEQIAAVSPNLALTHHDFFIV